MQRKGLTVGSLKYPTTTSISTSAPLKKQPKKPPSQNTITFQQKNKEYSVDPVSGTTLLDAALNQHQNINYKCRKGTCGKCQVNVLKGGAVLSPLTEAERNKLKNSRFMNERLACQAKIK